jgi:hypothetical protein
MPGCGDCLLSTRSIHRRRSCSCGPARIQTREIQRGSRACISWSILGLGGRSLSPGRVLVSGIQRGARCFSACWHDKPHRTHLIRLIRRQRQSFSWNRARMRTRAMMGGLTALMYAVKADSALRSFLGAGLVRRLLRYGADPGVKNLDGRVVRGFHPDDASRTILDSQCEGRLALGERYCSAVCDSKQDISQEIYRLAMLYLAS